MTSRQLDALQEMAEALDNFAQAFGQDFPSKAAEVEQFGADLSWWAQNDPTPEVPSP
jgi:hypothetical protein